MRSRHLHIISAGKSIDETFPVANRSLVGITDVFVIVEADIFQDPDVGETNTVRRDIRAAISHVERIAREQKMSFQIVKIPDTTLESVRDGVLEVYETYPGAQVSINITGGTKMLSTSLFTMALWVEADVCLTPKADEFHLFRIPRMHVREISKNPNHIEILRIIERHEREQKKNSTFKPILRKELFNQLSSVYLAQRVRSEKTDRLLHQGTFTRLIEPLMEWGLVEESYREGSRKDKQYSLTSDGYFTLKFMRMQQCN